MSEDPVMDAVLASATAAGLVLSAESETAVIANAKTARHPFLRIRRHPPARLPRPGAGPQAVSAR